MENIISGCETFEKIEYEWVRWASALISHRMFSIKSGRETQKKNREGNGISPIGCSLSELRPKLDRAWGQGIPCRSHAGEELLDILTPFPLRLTDSSRMMWVGGGGGGRLQKGRERGRRELTTRGPPPHLGNALAGGPGGS